MPACDRFRLLSGAYLGITAGFATHFVVVVAVVVSERLRFVFGPRRVPDMKSERLAISFFIRGMVGVFSSSMCLLFVCLLEDSRATAAPAVALR